jgi:hypothetical protein
MEDRNNLGWAIVDVEVGMSDHKIHDIGALRYDGAVYHGCKKEDLFAFLNSVNFLCGQYGYRIPFLSKPFGRELIFSYICMITEKRTEFATKLGSKNFLPC